MFFFFFKQKTAYEIYQCDWSSDVCSSDLIKKQEESTKKSVLEEAHKLVNNVVSQIPEQHRTMLAPKLETNLQKSIPQITTDLRSFQEKSKTEVILKNISLMLQML